MKEVVERNDTVAGKVFDLSIQALIIVSLITFSIETLPNISPQTREMLRWAEVGTVGVFTMEYLLRLLVADRKLSFIFSFYGIVDLVAILPFYLSTGADLRAVRAFRLLRLFKFFRYSDAIGIYARALKIVKDELVVFGSAAAIVLFVSAVGVYYLENEAQPDVFSSIFDGLWWAIATLTTVGYGDVYPVTAAGKAFTGIILVIGLAVVGVPIGLFASALMQARREMREPPKGDAP